MTDEHIGFWNRPWLQVFVGIVVTSGLLVVWIIQYAEPIITANSELAGIEAQIALKRAEFQESNNKIKEEQLEQATRILRTEIESLSKQNRDLQSSKKTTLKLLLEEKNTSQALLSKYRALALNDKTIVSSEKEGKLLVIAESLVQSSEHSMDKLKKEISSLEKRIEEAESENQRLNENFSIVERWALEGFPSNVSYGLIPDPKTIPRGLGPRSFDEAPKGLGPRN